MYYISNDPVFDSLKTFKVVEDDLKNSPVIENFIPWNCGIPHSQETRDLISNKRKNHAVFKDRDDNIYYCHLSDLRVISGEFVGIATNKIAVKDKHGNNYLVDKNDPRYKSGEFVGINKGKTWKQKNVEHHGNKGTILVKDKHGNMCRMTKDDPRYISKEFIHFRSKF
jgi:hypothetical protein